MWINLKECDVEYKYVQYDIININSEMHNKYTNRLWAHAFVARCISSAQVDTQ